VIGLIWFVLAILVSPFRSKARLEAAITALRQQLIVLRRKSRVRLTHGDRLLFDQLYRWFPSILPVLQIVRPETLVRWHRAGFRSYWKPYALGYDLQARTFAGLNRQFKRGNPRIGELYILGIKLELTESPV
jgi:hypothetical protein